MYDTGCLLQRIIVKEGDLTIRTAAHQEYLLLELIHLAREIEIDLRDVLEIDAVGLQLLIMAKTESIRLGRSLLLSNATEVTINALESKGLGRLLNP